MKSVLLAAALGVAIGFSVSGAEAATVMSKGPTDVQIYCSFAPWAAKCATPAKAVAVKTVAMVKPVAAKPAATGLKTMSCVPAAKGKAYLYECVWK